MSSAEQRIVITGGPGAGKSTLAAALAAQGFHTMPEAGRGVIRAQLAIGGAALPWGDPLAFAEQMLGWDMRSYEEAAGLAGPVIFDRGIADILGYLRLCAIDAPAHMRRAAENLRYARRVFIAPPWREIFTRDAERRQSFAEATATYRVMVEVYGELGYELVELPLASPDERIAFVRAQLAAPGR